ncbi:MAG: DUF2240 family protein [Euryarchaeota archaeon TMED85]|nr:MAG: hypothetical protein CMA04_000400 [Euryarchaeota archaeon]RPG76686.1 MAG: DUF2240 family protein [Euryarchaeota archaeon TMED85]|tara:strand:- start:4076 stop:4660 length:585 start_codon:yes stop_codon:yes gene_type:complete
MSDLEVEVRRLIHISFNDYPNEWISSEKLIRIWSLDLQWVDSNDAQKLLQSLIKTGWLQIKDNSVKPIESLYSLDIPIGWNPMVRRMIDGVDFIPSEAESINEKQLITSNPIVESSNVSSFVEDNPSTPNDRFVDPMIQKISEIRSHIATVSGLEIREIQRRAQRKRKACMPMTLWMALLLVGREQRIDISLFL